MRSDRYTDGQFSWVDLSTSDLQGALDFYTDVFGWTAEPVTEPGGYTMLLLGGRQVAGAGELSAQMRAQGVPPTWNSYLHVDDLDDTVERAFAAGAAVLVPAMQVGEAGRMAFLADREGAAFGLWEPGVHRGAEVADVAGAWLWNELNTRDPDAAESFYGKVLGWTFEPMEDNPSPYWLIRTAAGAGANDHNGGVLQMSEEWGDVPAQWMVYFAVGDVHATVDRVRGAGGTLHHGPFDTLVGPMAVVSDPQGAVFMVMHPRPLGSVS